MLHVLQRGNARASKDLSGILGRGWERSQKVVAWDGITQTCKAECSVHAGNDGSCCAQAHSPAGVGRNGIQGYVDLSRERFTGDVCQMLTWDAGTRAPLCT